MLRCLRSEGFKFCWCLFLLIPNAPFNIFHRNNFVRRNVWLLRKRMNKNLINFVIDPRPLTLIKATFCANLLNA